MKRFVVHIHARANELLDGGLETPLFTFLFSTKLLHGEPHQTKKCTQIPFLKST